MGLGQVWSKQDEAQLRAWCDAGVPYEVQASRLGRTKTSVEQKAVKLGVSPYGTRGTQPKRPKRTPRPALGEDVRVDLLPEAPQDWSDRVSEWWDEFRPVAISAPPPYQATTTPTATTLVAGDLHFPAHCEASCAVFLETVARLKPARVILNGDTVDLLAVSRYPKDQRFTWSLREEAEAFHRFLHELVRIGSAWGLDIVETEANHSGNGTASRWHRYISDRAPALYAHPKAADLLAYQTWWYPEWAPIRLAESVVIADDLLVIHGDIVRKHAAYSARAHAEKWHSSVMHSHTHRMGASMERIPAIGNRPEGIRRAFEIGCLCDLKPSYVTAPNWTNGFAIVQEDASGDGYGVELVTIHQGAAVVTTLGETVRAA